MLQIHEPTPATKTKQAAVVAVFANKGTMRQAWLATGVAPATIRNWLAGDVDGFREKIELAQAEFVGKLEDKLFNQVLDDPKPNPLLLMFTLKAHNRAKYGDQVVVVNDKAHELLDAVRGLPSGGVVVEGEIVSGEEEVRRSVEG